MALLEKRHENDGTGRRKFGRQNKDVRWNGKQKNEPEREGIGCVEVRRSTELEIEKFYKNQRRKMELLHVELLGGQL